MTDKKSKATTIQSIIFAILAVAALLAGLGSAFLTESGEEEAATEQTQRSKPKQESMF